jgi:hypothetical protein
MAMTAALLCAIRHPLHLGRRIPARPRTQGQETAVVRWEAATGVDWV